MTSSPRHWFVLGAGSIGCLYAALLRRAGLAVTLLLRDAARVHEFAGAGLTLRSDAHDQHIDIAACAVGDAPPVSHLLLCTKAQHSRAAIAALLPRLAADAVVVLLQNGMGVREELTPLLPQARFVHALSTEGVWQPQRFTVVHAGRGETVLGGADADTVAQDFARAGLATQIATDIEPRLWQKLAVNCVINPLTAELGCRNGELEQWPELATEVAAICAEIAAVAAAAGVALAADALARRVREVIRTTAANRSSMLQDVMAGRSTEIDYLNGYIVRLGQHYGIAVPANAARLAAVRSLNTAACAINPPRGYTAAEMSPILNRALDPESD